MKKYHQKKADKQKENNAILVKKGKSESENIASKEV